jgi:uncharacterized membrane protein
MTLSVRFSDQPQRWAAAPAVFFTLAGLISLIGSDTVNYVFGWVWPPVLLGLVVGCSSVSAGSCTAERRHYFRLPVSHLGMTNGAVWLPLMLFFGHDAPATVKPEEFCESTIGKRRYKRTPECAYLL